jgi:hypothetical protein
MVITKLKFLSSCATFIKSINKKKHINITNKDRADSEIDQPTKSKREIFISLSMEETILFFKGKINQI